MSVVRRCASRNQVIAHSGLNASASTPTFNTLLPCASSPGSRGPGNCWRWQSPGVGLEATAASRTWSPVRCTQSPAVVSRAMPLAEGQIWVVGDAASLHAALAGVMAGVAFTGLVLFMQSPPPEHLSERRQLAYELGLRHLFVAFFSLLIASLLYGITAGYKADLLLPSIVVVPASVGFAMAVSHLTVAMTWMAARYSKEALPTARKCAVGVMFLGGLVVADTAGDVLPRLGCSSWELSFTALGLISIPAVLLALPYGRIKDDEMRSRNHSARAAVAVILSVSVAVFAAYTMVDDTSTLVTGLNLATWQRHIVVATAATALLATLTGLVFLARSLPASVPAVDDPSSVAPSTSAQ